MPKITKRLVEAAEVREKDYIICDDELRGVAVRVLPSGRRCYIVQYRIGSRYRRLSLGQHGVLTTEKARTQAFKLLAAVKDGKDPAGERQERRLALTVAELANRFDKEHIAVRLKLSSAREYRRNLRRFILPAIGRLKVADVTKADMARLHHELRHIPYQANRNLEVISKMFNLAELWGLRPDGSNPRRHIRKYPEEKRERYLTPAELAALGEALSRAEQEGVEDPYAIAAVRLLIFTGCRLNEIMTLKWDYVHFEARSLRLPDSKTGARVVHLGAPALEVLARLQRQSGNPWVICGKKRGSRRSDLQPPWQRFRQRATVRLWARSQGSAAADLVHRIEYEIGREGTYEECLAAAKKQDLDLPSGLVDVRIHDLRHSFASGAVALGESLPMIGKLLGHTQVQTTARYAHLAADPVKAAAERVSSNIAALISGETGEVVPLRARPRPQAGSPESATCAVRTEPSSCCVSDPGHGAPHRPASPRREGRSRE
jgi:integrase